MEHKHLALIIAAALSALSLNAQASGYRFGSQSVAAQGSADANAAEANDASTLFYNPAGMARLEGRQIQAGATIVVPHSTYTDTGSTHFTGTSTGGTAASGYAPDSVTAPSLYFAQKINDQWAAGIGLFVPYGAKLDYGNTWTGRYALSNIKLESVALNPSVSFKLNQQHSFGFGISAEHMKANLGQAVDVPGGIAATKAAALRGNPTAIAQVQAMALAGVLPLLGSVNDGHGSMDGDDWGYGFNLGYLFQLNESTRFGLAYRSSVSHKLKGDAVWDFSGVSSSAVLNRIVAAASGKGNSGALVELHTPETVSANFFHQIDSKWAAMGDLTWTRTSRLGNLNIQFPNSSPAEGDLVIRQQWKDTYRLSLGTNYKYNDKLMLRAGVAFDESPVRSAELTHPALPDSDRYQFSLGASYKLSPQSSIDLAYSYLDFKDARLNYTNGCTPVSATGVCTGNGETTRGVFKTYLQLLGVAYNYKF